MIGSVIGLFACAATVAMLYLTGLATPDEGTVAVQVFAWVGGGLFYRCALLARDGW